MRTWALALAAAALLAHPGRANGEEPGLPAVLDGDPALVITVGEELLRRGVMVAGTEGEAVHAHLAQTADGIQLALLDPQGRTAERLVVTPDTAAALIESWTRRGIAQPLLAPRRPAVVSAPPVVQAQVNTPAAAAPSPWTPILRLNGETSTADRSVWLGASAGACARVGRFCLGAALHFGHQLDEGRDGLDPRFLPPPDRQSEAQAMLLAELPISLGRPVLLLGLSAGPAWQEVSGSWSGMGMRTEARVGLALPIWSRLAIEVGLAATLARWPGDHHGETPEDTDGSGVRAGFGLRWGLP